MTKSRDDKRDFFVSFTEADRLWATWIAWVLEDAGYGVWFQDWDFKGNFILEMNKAHNLSRRTVAVLSPDYLNSKYPQSEWAGRVAQDATSEHDLLIPVRVRPCELAGLFAPIVYVDLVGCGEVMARDKILGRVKGIRLKPDGPPLFPGEVSHDAVPERPAFPAARTGGAAATFDAVASPPVAWNAKNTSQRRERKQEEGVLAVAFSPNGSRLATAGANKTAQLWSVPDLNKASGPLRHDEKVNTVAFSPDGQVLASGGADQVVRIWDVASGGERLSLRDDKIEPSGTFSPLLAFNKSGTLLATSLAGQLRVWDLSTGRLLPRIPAIKDVSGIAFRPFDRLLSTAGGDGLARIVDVDSGEELMGKEHPFDLSKNGIKQVTFSPDGRLLATVGENGSAGVWEIESGAEVSELRRDAVASVVFSQVGRRLAAARTDGTIRVWGIDNSDELFGVEHGLRKVSKFACNPDATAFAILGSYFANPSGILGSYFVMVRDVQGGLILPQEAAFDVEFSPDGSVLATACGKSVRLWASKGLQQGAG